MPSDEQALIELEERISARAAELKVYRELMRDRIYVNADGSITTSQERLCRLMAENARLTALLAERDAEVARLEIILKKRDRRIYSLELTLREIEQIPYTLDGGTEAMLDRITTMALAACGPCEARF